LSNKLEILQRYWGYSLFRPKQEEIISSVLNGDDVLAVLSTGSGKSLCFQVPALVKDGICIVISPLIALIQNQVEELKEQGIKAAYIPSGSSPSDVVRILDNVSFDGSKFLYLSPERLQSKVVQTKIKEFTIGLIAIDEAHCISEWGHDFRPSFRNINILREICPDTNWIALTGTATKKVTTDITKSLVFENPKVYKESLVKENISYRILDLENKEGKLLDILKKFTKPSIIYCNSRNKTERVASFLNTHQIDAVFYHAGLDEKEKIFQFEKWMNEEAKVMVATTAFGMGINKKNVGLILHIDLPTSIENYVQQVGRAGRDGKKAFGVLLKNSNDVRIQNENLQNSIPTISEIRNIYRKLFQQYQIATGEISEEFYFFDNLTFSKKYDFQPKKVATTLQILQSNGIVEFSANQNEKSTIQFITSSKIVINYAIRNIYIKKFINSLLRKYTGLYKQKVYINEYELSRLNQIPFQEVVGHLQQLERDKIINYSPQKKGTKIRFLHPREDDYTINKIGPEIESYLNQKKSKSKDLLQFISNKTVCRKIQIATYFDEKNGKNCGKCDVCLSKTNHPKLNISDQIIQLLESKNELSSREICLEIEAPEKMILIHLQELLAVEKIKQTEYNKYRLNES
tara:strand:+ start:83560 stop:85455 length:1896 start_codon:yes stop_codon:yes gene_type:complete